MKFEIIPYPRGEGHGGTLYTYHVTGRTDNELDRFFKDPEINEAPDFPVVRDRLQRMIANRGFYHAQSDFGENRWFREEPDGTSALWAPIPQKEKRRYPRIDLPTLRLYCFRIDFWPPDARNPEDKGQILIAGYGGIKRVKNPREQPELQAIINEVALVRRLLRDRLEGGTAQLTCDLRHLAGNLVFQT